MRRVPKLSLPSWRAMIGVLAAVLALTVLLGVRLDTLQGDYSRREVAALRQSDNFADVWHNPVNAPHKLAVATQWHFMQNKSAVRVTSAVIGIITVVTFFALVSLWHSRLGAVFATILMASSAWFLHIARLGTLDSALWLAMLLFAAGLWLRYGKHSSWQLPVLALLFILTITTPGMIWFMLGAIVFGWRYIGAMLHQTNKLLVSVILVLVVSTLAVFGWRLGAAGGDALLAWLGLPQQLPSLAEAGKNLVNIPLQLAWRGPENAEIWLGQLPYLQTATLVLFIFGIAYYVRNSALNRLIPLASFAVISILLIAINGSLFMHMLLPVVYLFVAAGICYLLKEWRRIFPRNPIAQGFAFTLVGLLVAINVLYTTRHYFVAWPNAPETKKTFVL